MAGEISPSQYHKYLKNTKLLEISLIKSSSNLVREKLAVESFGLENPIIDLEDNYKFTSKNDIYIITVQWQLTAKFEKDKDNFLDITAVYSVILGKKNELPKKFWDIYKKATLPLIVYPYFREFIQNITSRMNIPPLTLPILFR